MAVWGRGVIWPYPEVVDGYALPLEGPGLGIEANAALVDEALAASKPFVPSLQPRLNALDGSVRDFWEDHNCLTNRHYVWYALFDPYRTDTAFWRRQDG